MVTKFQSILDEESNTFTEHMPGLNPAFAINSSDIPLETVSNTPSRIDAISAYEKQAGQLSLPGKSSRLKGKGLGLSDWEKYKDDQLLSNPGGDHYYLEQNKVVPDPKEQESFLGRIGKDIADALGNVKNFFKNLLFGSKRLYRDKNNQIQEVRQRGLIGSVMDFFSDIGSALSFGMWRPDGEKEPEGFVKRVGFFFSKIKEAIFGDLIQGVAGSVINIGEDIALAGWNLLEVIPDATVGNFESGRKLTTAIFDNGQVAIDYLTDILPGGEAWSRVHAADFTDPRKLSLPVVHNLNMPERHSGDVRWRYVRNTPFRKAIETIGSLLFDFISLRFMSNIKFFSEEEHPRLK
ncbi:MAG: hypothetical protein SV375_15305 [Thermodesulfobacteriota bacterium]|nr:hypothetical protein [Thermodesulfobacteriota bacterium]